MGSPRWLVTTLLFALLPGCRAEPAPIPDGGGPFDAGATLDGGRPLEDSGRVEPDASTTTWPPEPCDGPGSVERVPCGRCGQRERTCGADRTWAYGPCNDEHGVCEPGDTSVVACGRCGERARSCAHTCEWLALGACLGETGACAPGETTRTTAGCPAGQARVQTCGAACAFEDGPCEAAECTPGATESAACGRCGTRTRTCDDGGRWLDGPCAGEGECMPGDTRSVPCGFCGAQASACDDACAWRDTGTCTGVVSCPPPPVRACLDATTLRLPGAAACVSGACEFAVTDRVCVAGCSAGACVGGAPLLGGLGGAGGYGASSIGSSDDGSSTAIDLTILAPTGLRFYDGTYTTAFVNNNGNLSFGAVNGAYRPDVPGGPVPVIAGLWGDVDTGGGGQPARNDVTWALDGARLVATWNRVGYYPRRNDLENSFQIVLTPRADVAPGDFDVELRFAQCEWHPTVAAGPVGSGFASGDGTRGLALPGSGTARVLDLCATSNVGTPGLHRFEVRGGVPLAP